MKIQRDNIDYYYINLDSRLDRRANIELELSKVGIQATRLSACTPDLGYSDTITLPSAFNNGNRGCFFSHYNLWTSLENSDRVIGVFEDDAYFCDDYNERFSIIENTFDLDWDIFFLSSFFHLNDDPQRWKDKEFEFTNIRSIVRVHSAFCTHSYLINPKSIGKVLDLTRKNIHNASAIDHLLILIQSELNCYSFVPGMVMQYTNYSDITNGDKDQESFVTRLGSHVFTKKLNEFDFEKFYEKYGK